jgi:hypothetical protein
MSVRAKAVCQKTRIPAGLVSSSCHQQGTGSLVADAGDRENDERSSSVPGRCRCRVPELGTVSVQAAIAGSM